VTGRGLEPERPAGGAAPGTRAVGRVEVEAVVEDFVAGPFESVGPPESRDPGHVGWASQIACNTSALVHVDPAVEGDRYPRSTNGLGCVEPGVPAADDQYALVVVCLWTGLLHVGVFSRVLPVGSDLLLAAWWLFSFGSVAGQAGP
jgi:hypothetical protein